MKKIYVFIIFIILGAFFVYFLNNRYSLISPVGRLTQDKKPLLAYTFENLKKTSFPATQITLGKKVDENADSISQMFYFSVPEKPNSKKLIKVSGLMNIPKQPGIYPVIIMFRGFVPDPYSSGIGTQPSALVFARNGFITLAPDFLGFGESANPSSDAFENRFQTYTTALTLFSSVKTLNTALDASYSGVVKADLTKVGVWGHSNGGSIALSVMAISGLNYPTVLWAPVSKSFPYSILYYTDEADDQGKSARKITAEFEENYDADKFSPTNYYKWIRASIEIFQGEADEEVPVWWSNDLVAILKKQNKDVNYFTYPGAGHNLQPSGWTDAVNNSISFYNSYFK